jgi:hypothetical protein
MACFSLPRIFVAALAFASGAVTVCINVLTGLWREVSTRVSQVLAKFSPMIHTRPGVQIVRAVSHQATFMRRSLSRREANYLRTCT